MSITINADYPANIDGRPTRVEVFIDDNSVDRITSDNLDAANDLICDVIGQLGLPGRTATTAPATGTIELVGDGNGQAITVVIGGEEIASTNFDESGWTGVEAVHNTAAAIARKFGITLIENGV